jgi:hypothetical protein
MFTALGGLVILIVTATVFWLLLPRGDKVYRLADTEWEPYVGVAFTAAVALSLTMMLSGVLDFLSTG